MTRSALVLRHVAFEHLGVIGSLLAARNFDVRFVEVGSQPVAAADLLAADLVIVLGGPIGVYETADYPWLEAEIAAIRARLDAQKPILGICLGGQLMAAALGAKVAPGPAKEIGYAPLSLTEQGRASVLAPLDGQNVLHWHGDAFETPEGATRLAYTEICPSQAFAIGRHALALQFHIEVDPKDLEAWLIGHTCELGKAGIKPGVLRTQAAQLGAEVAGLGEKVIGDWLEGVLR